MMVYYYNQFGWFDGEVPESSERSTSIAPPAVDDPALRANWTGHKWIVMEYRAPPSAQEVPVVGADGLTDDERATLRPR